MWRIAPSIFIESSSNLQVIRTFIKSRKNLNWIRDWTIHFRVTLSAEKHHIRPCPEHSLFSFNRVFMRLAVNLDRHKISDEFEYRPH